MKRIGIFILFIMLISNISINVYAKKGDEIKAYKKFLNKEKAKYCLGEKFDDITTGLYVGYYYLDIDGNGVKELVIVEENERRENIRKIYTYKNKKVVQVPSYEGIDYNPKDFYNKKYGVMESFVKHSKYKKIKYFYGYPLYRVKGKKDIICEYFVPGVGISKMYIYYKYKDGKFYETATSSLNSYDEWEFKDSYLYKSYNLKDKLVKIKRSDYVHLVSVEKDFETGNTIILNVGN